MQRALAVVLLSLALGSVLCLAADQQTYAKLRPLQFSDSPDAVTGYLSTPSTDDSYLARLRSDYELDRVIAGKKNDFEKARALTAWTHARWDNDGQQAAEKQDAISILEEAHLGRDFRCQEYSIVLSAALNAVDIPARVVNLIAEDVESRDSGADHVVVEAYIFALKKWVMLDPQWDAAPTIDGRPLNAVEFQHALAERVPGLTVETAVGMTPAEYKDWVAPYLYYFKVNLEGEKYAKADSLVLLPLGAKEVSVLRGRPAIGNVIYTHSLSAFYPAPSMSL